MLQVEQNISFHEIVPDTEVRVAVIDGVQYLSIRDVFMCVCGKDNNTAGAVWRNLSQDKKDEVQKYVLNFQFSGPGQSSTPVITFPGALKMIMFLPGDAAKMHRSTMATILTRYYAGDKSLIQEVETNSVSESPICQSARPPCAPELVRGQIDNNPLKHKNEEAEIYKPEIETEAVCLQANTQLACMDKYNSLCANTVMDETAKEMFKKVILTSPVFPRVAIAPVIEPNQESITALETSYQAKLQEKDNLIFELRTKNAVPPQVWSKDNFVLENLRKAFVICKESPSPITEEVLYDAFLKFIPLWDHVRNLEALFSICNPGKRLTKYFIKLFQEKKHRVCQENFGYCLEMIGGEYTVHRQVRRWKNVLPRCVDTLQ